MNNANNYSQPRAKAGDVTVNLDGVSVKVAQSPLRVYDRFEVYDDVSEWRSIPRKIMNINGTDFLVFAGSPAEIFYAGAYFKTLQRNLVLNSDVELVGTSERRKRLIPIQRPLDALGVPKKAYLHSLMYIAYDYNEMIPKISDAEISAISTILTGFASTDPGSLIVLNAFGDLPGIALKMLPDPLQAEMDYVKSTYTTADYPFNHYKYKSNNTLPDTQYMREYRKSEVAVIDKFGQTASKSTSYHGIMSDDFLINNFVLKVGALTGLGYDDTTINLPPPEMKIYDSESCVNGATLLKNQSLGNDDVTYWKQHGSDLILPQVQNEIDTLIPDNMNYLTVDVAGCGWVHGVDLTDHILNVKMLATNPLTDKIPCVIVQMPVKVQVILRYE